MYRGLSLQATLFPCNGKYGDKEIAALKHSWAHVVQQNMLPFLASVENDFAGFFSATMGRPIKYISLLIVLHLFKEMNDWTDEELVAAAYFDKRFEYAFDLPFHDIIVCQKTLHNFRRLLLEHELAGSLFERAASHIIQMLNLDTTKQRLDSSHIVSNMAKLSRLGLFVRVIENFLRKLKHVAPQRYAGLPARFRERYGKRRGYFADTRSGQAQLRLGECAQDMWDLLDRFRGDEAIASLKVMALLQRVFTEHCAIEKSAETTAVTVELRDEPASPTAPAAAASTSATAEVASLADHAVVVQDAKNIPSSALQNPSDEDAAYGYKGQGYEVALAETCSPNNAVQLITAVQVHASNQSDQQATMAIVEQLEDNNRKPEVLHTDGGFVSGENIIACAEKGVDLQGILTGCDSRPDNLKLVDFAFAADGLSVTACPAGHAPLRQQAKRVRRPDSKKREQGFRVHFACSACATCPLLHRCPIHVQKKSAVLSFTRAELASSQRRREQESVAFKERNKIRAGIESTNAEMKKRHGLGRLRVRHRQRVEMVVFFKAMGCNVKRMVEYVLSLDRSAPPAPIASGGAPKLAYC
jgi:hypothetical protein